MTPTATLLLRTLESEAAHWDDVTTTDAPMIARQRAEARRDGIDYAIAQLKVAIPAIEGEAVEEYRGVADWLDAGAGIAA
jgi:molybdate-binding protein